MSVRGDDQVGPARWPILSESSSALAGGKIGGVALRRAIVCPVDNLREIFIAQRIVVLVVLDADVLFRSIPVAGIAPRLSRISNPRLDRLSPTASASL